MRAVVLGSAAGGGFPQWNCACPNCSGVRAGRLAARTQASLAVTGDGLHWLLLGASPDVRAQIAATRDLWPTTQRGSPIVSVALPNGDLDAWLGLLSLREWTPLEIAATDVVRRDLLDNPILRTLDRFDGQSRFCRLAPGVRHPVKGGLTVEAIPAPGKPPLHARRPPHELDNVGFLVRDEKRGCTLAWFPSVAGPTAAVERALSETDAVFFDGTFYTEDELKRFGVDAPVMGHWPLSASAAFLEQLPARSKWLVHINNTNPILDDQSRERAQLLAAGIGVAFDGLEWRA